MILALLLTVSASGAPGAGSASIVDPVPVAAVAPATPAEVQRLLELTGAVQLAGQMLDQMTASMQASMPQVPPSVWVEVRAEMRAEELVAATAAIYERHFTAEEIAGLIAFYESPLGRKLIAEQPAVVAESMAVGQEWGVKAAQRAMERLKAKGVVF